MSVRPPPATIPTIPRQELGSTFLAPDGELDTGLALVGVVADDGDVVTRGTTERTTVTGLVFDVGEDGTFGNGGEREDVSDGQGSVLAGVDELCSVSPVFLLALGCPKLTWPVYMPSLAMKVWVSCLNRYGCNTVSGLSP